jgi:hypothetical protein
VLDLSFQRPIAEQLAGLPVAAGSALSQEGGFYGAFPSTWSGFTKLKQLRLQGNRLTGPINTLSMVQLQTLDLSYNRLTQATQSLPRNQHVGVWMGDLLSQSLVSLRASYNNLTGPCPAANFLQSATTSPLRELRLDHNHIQTMPPQLFASSLVKMDFSYNDLRFNSPLDYYTGKPAASVELFNLAGNPKLVYTPQTIINEDGSSSTSVMPEWVALQDSREQLPGKPFSCFRLKGTSAPDAQIAADPELFSFAHCVCASGTYPFPTLPNSNCTRLT